MHCTAAMLLFVIVFFGIGLSSTALADGTGAFGALAYDIWNDRFGYAFDQADPAAAERRALAGCKSPKCAVKMVFHEGCAAYAIGPHAVEGLGTGPDRATAQKRALAECSVAANGPYCTVKTWTCNTKR